MKFSHTEHRGRGFLIALVILLAFGQQFSFPRDFEIDKHLSMLEQNFELAYARINKPVSQLNESYSSALERLFKAESGAGRLDSSIQVKKELEDFDDGSEFDSAVFTKRGTKNQVLEEVRRKYLSERDRLHNLNRDSRGKQVNRYRDMLKKYELEQTKLGKVEVAITARKLRENLDKDPRFPSFMEALSTHPAFEGVIRFVGKGDIELHLNGARVSFRNKADERSTYVDGKSRPQRFRIGDVLRIKMRTSAVFRSLIMTIESNDDAIAIPIKQEDYRYQGAGIDTSDIKLETIMRIESRPESGNPDVNMSKMWEEQTMSVVSRNNSEWMKLGASGDWHTYYVVIKKDMLLPAK